MTAPPPGELARFRAIFLKFYRISPHLLLYLLLHLYLYLLLHLYLYLLLYLLLLLLLPPAEVPAGREKRGDDPPVPLRGRRARSRRGGSRGPAGIPGFSARRTKNS